MRMTIFMRKLSGSYDHLQGSKPKKKKGVNEKVMMMMMIIGIYRIQQ